MIQTVVIPWLITYRYLAIFPLAVLEGPILSVVCGFLLHFGYFDLVPLYITLVLGDLVGDIIWYYIGYFGARPLVRRYGHMVNLTEQNMARIEEVFKRHQNKTILLSKMSMGLGFALVTLTTAGAIRIPMTNFVIMNVLGGFFWSGVLLLVGYFFGNLYMAIDRGFRIVALVGFAIVLALALYGFKRYVQKKVVENKI